MNRRTLMHLVLTCACWAATAVLIVLRLAGAVDWPWWWLVAPLWLPFVISGVGFAVLAATERFG